MSSQSPLFKILSLDGGGTWAIIEAMTLGDLFGQDTPGHEILKQFDLVAANSGGSIVLAALACNHSPAQMAELFSVKANRDRIFVRRPFMVPALDELPVPRYQTEEKIIGLRAVLGPGADLPLQSHYGDAMKDLPRLIIAAFDYDRQRARFFRSRTSPAASSTAPVKASLMKAIHASSNAPVYFFNEPASWGGRRYWDGAIAGYNNPVLAAVTEALALLPGQTAVTAKDVRVLSIGTGSTVLPQGTDSPAPPKELAADVCRPGLISDIKEMAMSILDDPPDAASFVAYVALGLPLPPPNETVANPNFVRMSPLIQPLFVDGQWVRPEGLTASDFAFLRDLQMDAVAEFDVEMIEKLCEQWHAGNVANQPIRPGHHFSADVGFDRYGPAKAAALSWLGAPRARL
jgi:hypothetical protein